MQDTTVSSDQTTQDADAYLLSLVKDQTSLTGSSPHCAAEIFVATRLQDDRALTSRFDSTRELVTYVWQRFIELIRRGTLVYVQKAGGYYEVHLGRAA